jgi:hypothetical protein
MTQPPVFLSTIAAAAFLTVSVVTADAAGTYDGTWQLQAPRNTEMANPLNPRGCDPVVVEFNVKDDQISGQLGWTGFSTVGPSDGRRATPVTGRVSPDGTVSAEWQGIIGTGKMTGNKAQMTWRSDCGTRTATGGRVSPPGQQSGSTTPQK